MVDQEMLALRRKIKSRKPTFVQQCAHKIKKISNKWRRPKGIQSKMRLKHKGKRKSPSLGYSSPRAVRGLNRNGLEEVLVHSAKDLESIDAKTQIVVVASVGMKKKVAILTACKEKNLQVSNIKDVSAWLKETSELMNKRKKERKELMDKKKKTEEKAKKKDTAKKEDKKEEAPQEVKEETKKGEKSDKIKILEKRQ